MYVCLSVYYIKTYMWKRIFHNTFETEITRLKSNMTILIAIEIFVKGNIFQGIFSEYWFCGLLLGTLKKWFWSQISLQNIEKKEVLFCLY